MGAVCCGQETRDISTFWRGLELRKISFDQFYQIYEKNQVNWLNSGESSRLINLKKCKELNKLLFNSDLTVEQREVFMEKLNEFVNNLSDKLMFFACLSFFTQLRDDENTFKAKKDAKESYLDSLRMTERKKNFDIVFSSLLKLAIKRNDHDDVTKLFIQLVTEFAVPFLYTNKKDIEEKSKLFSKNNREELFKQLKMSNLQKFYEYMFSSSNIMNIHHDLLRINDNKPLEDLNKVRITSNIYNGNDSITPRDSNEVKAK